jgi:DNA-binding NtrC family response regulator
MYEVWCNNLRAKSQPKHRRPLLVAKSAAMCRALETIDVVAPTTASVLVTGETGVGKELIARAVHAMSDRWKKLFVPLNCGAIPDNLIESVLFGHERGAFTGALEVHHGLFERADGGTLFLDEVDSLPLIAQVRLLRVLQGGDYERVGGKHTMRADVRIVAAASRSLKQLVREGKFREDLYFRLNVVPLFIPALRERLEEIPHLIDHFLGMLSQKYGRTVSGVTDEVLQEILAHGWKGNVRELENVLERSFLFARGPLLERLYLHDGDRPEDGESGDFSAGVSSDMPLKDAKKIAADRVEYVILKENLARHRGNVSAVAKALHLTPRAVHQKLNAHRIDPAQFRGKVGARLPEAGGRIH